MWLLWSSLLPTRSASVHNTVLLQREHQGKTESGHHKERKGTHYTDTVEKIRFGLCKDTRTIYIYIYKNVCVYKKTAQSSPSTHSISCSFWAGHCKQVIWNKRPPVTLSVGQVRPLVFSFMWFLLKDSWVLKKQLFRFYWLSPKFWTQDCVKQTQYMTLGRCVYVNNMSV